MGPITSDSQSKNLTVEVYPQRLASCLLGEGSQRRRAKCSQTPASSGNCFSSPASATIGIHPWITLVERQRNDNWPCSGHCLRRLLGRLLVLTATSQQIRNGASSLVSGTGPHGQSKEWPRTMV